MFFGQTTLTIRRKSVASDLCEILVSNETLGIAPSICTVCWPIFREKLRDAWSLGDSELKRVEEELLMAGTTKLQQEIGSVARIRALGFEWPQR